MAKSLLVIDNSSTIREAVQLALTGGEWKLVTATTGAEATEALQQHRVDVILCAVAPGEEDGYELCRNLGASAEGSGIPLLLMGGNVNATAALAVGAAATLPKPFTAEQLQHTLQETLEQSDFSFDFDDAPLTVADDEPLDLEPLAGEFELQPAAAPSDLLELDEIEVIDLSDDDQFEDLELLDDLEPVELSPVAAASGNEFADTATLGTPGDEDLEDLLADPDGIPAVGETDIVPMELTPEASPEHAAAGQEQATRWTVDGLMLGANEPAPAEHGEEEPPGADEPTTGDGHEIAPVPMAEVTPVAEAGDELPAEEPGPAPASPVVESADEPVDDALASVPDEQDLAPLQAETFSDLELEWAREAAPAEEEPFPQEEEAYADVALEEMVPPPVPEVEAPSVPEPGTSLDQEPDGDLEALEEEQVVDVGLETGTDTPVYSLAAEPTAPEEPVPTVRAAPAVPEDLAASVAASAGQAVREALEASLSAEHLAPLVAAAVERVAWEVVPQLAERLIRETIARLQEDPPVS